MGMPEHDTEGRVLCAEFDTFYLVTVYTPNSGSELKRLDYRQIWDQDFADYLKTLEQTKPVVVCGDLNVAHQDIDLARIFCPWLASPSPSPEENPKRVIEESHSSNSR